MSARTCRHTPNPGGRERGGELKKRVRRGRDHYIIIHLVLHVVVVGVITSHSGHVSILHCLSIHSDVCVCVCVCTKV